MPAPHASPTQNQIASLRMREHDAIELPSAPFDAITPMQGVSGYLPTVGAIVIGAAIAFGVVASGVGTPVLVGMLGVLATRRAVLPLRLLGRLHPHRSARSRSPRW